MASSDAAASPERPRPITVIGWLWLVASALRVLQSALSYVIWRAGGLDRGLPPLLLGRVQMPHAVDTMIRHLGTAILGQGLVAAAIGWSAWKLLELRPWARVAIEAAAWAFLLLTVLLVALLIVGFTGGLPGPEWHSEAWGSPARRVGLVCGVGLPAMGLFGATIYFLRRPDVRRAFRVVPG